jgi:hypothetical protein
MLTIRREQIQVFHDAVLQRWLVDHLAFHFPSLAGQEASLATLAIERARRWNFQAAAHVAQVANLLALLGPDFESDPRHAWAASVLASNADAEARITRLLEGAERATWGAALPAPGTVEVVS